MRSAHQCAKQDTGAAAITSGGIWTTLFIKVVILLCTMYAPKMMTIIQMAGFASRTREIEGLGWAGVTPERRNNNPPFPRLG